MKETSCLEDHPDIIERLKNIDAFAGWDDSVIHEILPLTTVRSYAPGECILREGEYDSWVYMVIFGHLEVIKEEEVIFSMRRSGDVFGEMGVIDGEARSATIKAVSPTACLAIDTSALERFVGPQREVLYAVLFRLFSQILASRLRTANSEVCRLKKELEQLKQSR